MSTYKVGTFCSETNFFKVTEVKGNNVVMQDIKTKTKVNVPVEYIDAIMTVSDKYATTKALSQTELSKLFEDSTNTAIRVEFYKKPDTKEVESFLTSQRKTSMTDVTFIKSYNELVRGELRTMDCYHKGEMNQLGFYNVVDLAEASEDKHSLRQVNPKTIQSIIVNNVKYTLKK